MDEKGHFTQVFELFIPPMKKIFLKIIWEINIINVFEVEHFLSCKSQRSSKCSFHEVYISCTGI